MTRWPLLVALACSTPQPPDEPPAAPPPSPVEGEYTWRLPPHFPTPEVPDDNPMSTAKVELGRHLFYDFQLSIDGGRSCGICHEPAKGFTDGFVRAVGTTRQVHPRNTPSLTNIAFRAPLTWRHPTLDHLEEQLLTPLMGTEPIVEMGMGGQEALLVDRLRGFDPYPRLFAAAYPEDDDPFRLDNIAKAIATFERTILSGTSPYDRFLAGDVDALPAAAQRGRELFFGDRLGCGACHGGLFLDRPGPEGSVQGQSGFYNTGQYNTDGKGSYPDYDQGLVEVTGLLEDTGRFRTPSLRNVARTPPYNHDGTTATLSHVLANYARGGRNVSSGRHAGDGKTNPYKDPRITGFDLTDDDEAALLAFLDALTDEEALADPAYADPFCRDRSKPAGCLPAFDPDAALPPGGAPGRTVPGQR